jgi:hypothetical protein
VTGLGDFIIVRWIFPMSGMNSGRWNRIMLNLCGIVVAILKMATGRNFSMSRINSGCPISTPFHVWVDYDVPNWFLTSKNFYRSPFSKWPPQYHTNSTLFEIRDIIIYPHIKFWWYRTMLNFCGIVVAILKMTTDRNCSMSGINSGHKWFPTLKNFYRSPFSKWPPQYRTNSTLSHFNDIHM